MHTQMVRKRTPAVPDIWPWFIGGSKVVAERRGLATCVSYESVKQTVKPVLNLCRACGSGSSKGWQQAKRLGTKGLRKIIPVPLKNLKAPRLTTDKVYVSR
jgi:hypothetical protein